LIFVKQFEIQPVTDGDLCWCATNKWWWCKFASFSLV